MQHSGSQLSNPSFSFNYPTTSDLECTHAPHTVAGRAEQPPWNHMASPCDHLPKTLPNQFLLLNQHCWFLKKICEWRVSTPTPFGLFVQLGVTAAWLMAKPDRSLWALPPPPPPPQRLPIPQWQHSQNHNLLNRWFVTIICESQTHLKVSKVPGLFKLL